MTAAERGGVRAWLVCLTSSAQIARRSLTALASWSTALVVCLATPLLSVAFLTVMTSAAGGTADSSTAYRCALMVTVTTAAALMVDLGMTDRRYGTIDSLLTNGGLASSGFWLGRTAVTAGTGVSVGTMTSLVVAGAARDVPGLWHLGFLALAGLVGSATGMLILAAGLPLRDPHVIATSFALLMPLLSTALVPADDYPRLLRPLTQVVPGAHVIDATRATAQTDRITASAIELGLTCTLFFGALLVFRVLEVRARRHGTAIMTS